MKAGPATEATVVVGTTVVTVDATVVTGATAVVGAMAAVDVVAAGTGGKAGSEHRGQQHRDDNCQRPAGGSWSAAHVRPR